MPFTPNPFEDPMSFLLIALIALFPFGGGAYYRSRSIYSSPRLRRKVLSWIPLIAHIP